MRIITPILMLTFLNLLAIGQSREVYLLNSNWDFAFGYEMATNNWERVQLPHTWNNCDAPAAKIDYYRGLGIYQKVLRIEKEWEGKRLFLKFDGVNTVANLFINNMHIGEHRGGYTAFIFEITDKVKYGEDNVLLLRVSNALQLDVMPLIGDFNVYGGIIRDVNLIITSKACISPLDYASPGVYLTQKNVNKDRVEVNARVLINNGNALPGNYEVQIDIFNGTQKVLTKSISCSVGASSQSEISLPFNINNPRLWNGRKDPFIYKALITLKQDNVAIDQVIQPLGLRSFYVDADRGFFLNGEHLQLHGVCRHQDYSGRGSALLPVHHEEDIAIINEIGANAIRLSHYPQSPYFYQLLDENGIVTWSEIPFVGPGGYRGVGYMNQPSFRANGKQQLLEMIRQNYNHPGICFWGIFNELKMEGDNPVEYLEELNKLAHNEDSSRITTSASFVEGPLNGITDLIGFNKYFGWYGGDAKYIGTWADETHRNYPKLKLSISEYGAGASIYQHQDSLVPPSPNSYWHPEAWQAHYHEENWKAISERPYIWGSFIWNLFDFSAAHRAEGDRPGINDKGLVTYDRKVKKDAFWFYKANWNKNEPVLYIADRRFSNRNKPLTDVKVYSNFPEVELFVNGVSLGKHKDNNFSVFNWENVKLAKGNNTIEVKAGSGKQLKSDRCVWTLE
jgi:beta-galactosidase